MAETKTINLDIETNLGSLKSQLRQAQAAVAELSAQFGATSQQAAEAAKRAAELKDRIEDAKNLTDAFNPDAKFNALSRSIGGALDGFQAFEGAIGLIGVESEALQATLLKVQSAMALSQGIQGAMEAKDSFIQLGAVVKNAFVGMTTASKIFMSVGILALVSGIIYLATEIKAVTRAFEDFTDWLGFTNHAAERNAKAIEDNARRVAAANDRVTASNRKRAEASAAAYDHEIAMAQIAGKDTTQLEIQKSQNQSQAARERYNNALKEYNKLKGQNSKFATERRKELKEQLEEERTFLRDERYAREQARAQASADRKEAYKEAKAERTAAQNEALRNAIEFENELNSRLEQIAEQNYLNSLSEQDKEIRLVQDKYFELETLAAGNADALREIEIAKLNEINDINLKYQQEAYDLDKEAAEKKKELDEKSKQERIEAEKAVAETLSKIREQDFNNIEAGLDLISSLFENNRKVQAAVLVAENAVGIAKTIMNTQAANQLARAQGTALAIASGGASVAAAEALVVRNNIGAGISIASQIAATAKGLSALKAGGAPASGSISDSGGGGGVMSPNFNIVGNSGFNQLAQIQQQPIQAYVVSGEVTSAQALDRNRIKNATL
jgi:hypothetical protein